jgi:hypothetical protein
MQIHSSSRRLGPIVCIVLVLAGLGAAACGPFRQGSAAPAALIFTNQALDHATVYVVGPGRDFRRLGTVFPGQTDTLRVPAEATIRGFVNIVARLAASSEVPQTGPVSMSPGGSYHATLPGSSSLISFLPAR